MNKRRMMVLLLFDTFCRFDLSYLCMSKVDHYSMKAFPKRCTHRSAILQARNLSTIGTCSYLLPHLIVSL